MKSIIEKINHQLGKEYFVNFSKYGGWSRKVEMTPEETKFLKSAFKSGKTFLNQEWQVIDQMQEDDLLDAGECVVCITVDSISFQREG